MSRGVVVKGEEGLKIITGSYRGTGGHGEESPNSLTLPFEPKMLIIIPFSSTLKRGGAPTVFINPCPFAAANRDPWDITSTGGGSSVNMTAVAISWGKTVSWYTLCGVAAGQLNGRNMEYAYVAVG